MPATGLQVRIVADAFDPQAEASAFCAGRDDAGALVTFCGYCRSTNKGEAVAELRLDQYEGFTEKEIVRIAQDVAARFSCPDLLVIHRVGAIKPGEAIVLVAALGTHRANAFEAVKVLMDYLKTDAPLWKRETGPSGARWIEPRVEDYARRQQADKPEAGAA
jgi:molybdopterin synthase catalytic subunit